MNVEKRQYENQEVEFGRHSDGDATLPSGGHEKGPSPGRKNILAEIPREQLLADVEEFANEKGLTEHITDLRKGALLAQDPAGFEYMKDLSESDKDTIRYENGHRWSHPKTLYMTIFICSIGAATQGWDQTGSNGANLSFPNDFGLGGGTEYDSWIIGLINSAPYIASAFLGCWLADPLNNLLGRRGVIFLTALCLIATPIGSAFAKSWEGLFVARLVLGLGMGCKGATVPIFAGENSPAQIRGALVMTWQLWTAFGIFLGTIANVVVADVTAVPAWRLQLGSAFIPAVPLAIGIFFCPESPRWLMRKNRYQEAYKSLLRLRFTPLQAARDLYYIHVQLEVERQIMGGATYLSRFTELFVGIPRVRRATLAAFTVMIGQQMCGINIIAFYSSSIFVATGYTPKSALFVSLGFGAVNFVFAFPALFTIDTYGRRTLLLATFPNMAWSLLAAGLCYLINDQQTRLATVATFIFIFCAFYSPGEGPVPFTYSAEVFPLAHREQGMGFAVATCLFWAAVLSLTYPSIERAFTVTGAFGFYAGLNIVAFFMILAFVPETKQLSLEELDMVFEVPTKVFMRHTFTQAIPYWFKRYVFRRKSERLEPMHLSYTHGLEVVFKEPKPRTKHIE